MSNQTYSIITKSQQSNNSDSESDSESDYTENSESTHSNVPAVLEEPVDSEAVQYTKKHKNPKKINLNVPKDKEVLLETKSPAEFDEPEMKLKEFDRAMRDFVFFNNPEKKKKSVSPKTNLEYWANTVLEKLNILKSDSKHIIVPIISFNNLGEIYNIGKFKNFVDLLKNTNRLTTVICNGNCFDSSIFTDTSFLGRHSIDLLNKCNIDIINFGNTDLKLDLESLKNRILEFQNEIILSNVLEFNTETKTTNKLHKTTGYLIRKFGKNSELSILFISLNNTENTNLYCNTDYINLLNTIFKTHSGKFNYVILSSSLEDSINKNILKSCKEVNLILGNGKYNNCFDYKNRKIVNSDSDLNSVYLNIIKFNKTDSSIQTTSINYTLDKKIKNNIEIDKISNYYYDLAFKELKMLYHIDPTEIISLNNNLDYEFFILDQIYKYININKIDFHYIVYDNLIDSNYINTEKYIKGYDIYKMCLIDSNIISLNIDFDILNNINKNKNLKIRNNINSNNSSTEIIIITTEKVLNNYISYYFSDQKTIKIYGTLRNFIYKSFKNEFIQKID